MIERIKEFRMKYIILLLIISIFSFNCSIGDGKKRADYNLLIIVSDALRADVLSCYGGKAETPNICKLASEGVLFETAYSNAPWTLPSSVAMLTGNYPSVYMQAKGKGMNSEVEKTFYAVNDSEVLLAEELRKKGYDVFYSLENKIPRLSNLVQGFDDIEEHVNVTETEKKYMKKVLNLDLEDRRSQENLSLLFYLMNTEKNFYILKWIMDPHAPYSPPRKLRNKINIDTSKLKRNKKYYRRISSKYLADLGEEGPTLDDYELHYVTQLYSREIESVDERLGKILKALEINELRDNTIIVFTSDHGEGFGEHGKFFHGGSYYEPIVRVPLIITGPGIVKGKRIKKAVSHIDLMPTLKDLLKIDCLNNAQGRSFKSSLVSEKESINDRIIYFVVNGGSGYPSAIRFKNYKLIIKSKKDIKLYNLSKDPEELYDLSKEKPQLLEELKEKIEKIRNENKRRKKKNMKHFDKAFLERMNKETIKKLRSLGYIQ